MKSLAELYESDFYQWSIKNAKLLRSGKASQADLVNIAGEIRDIGISQRLELISRASVLLRHLLKLQFSPRPIKKASIASWTATTREQRRELNRLLEQMPSLRRLLIRELPRIYQEAAEDAVFEGRLDPAGLPSDCPYSVNQILDLNYLPAR